jgi:hypothetical protein
MRCERGQATIEWVGLVLLASLVLGALAAAVPVVDGRSFGGFLSHRIVCAVKRSACADRALVRAYGKRDAELLRRHAPGLVYEPGEPSLPVDFRRCRGRDCSDAPADRELDVHRTAAGRRASVFTRVIRRGGRTYLQYWLYYPDSNSTFAGSDVLWRHSFLGRIARYPGHHDDDWEAHAVRIDRDGRVAVRSTSHGHWQWCKYGGCRNRWGPPTGWTRVSRGSHAGHVPFGLPGVSLRERTTTAEGLRLIPLESIERRHYRALDPGIKPPWLKDAWKHPESPRS